MRSRCYSAWSARDYYAQDFIERVSSWGAHNSRVPKYGARPLRKNYTNGEGDQDALRSQTETRRWYRNVTIQGTSRGITKATFSLDIGFDVAFLNGASWWQQYQSIKRHLKVKAIGITRVQWVTQRYPWYLAGWNAAKMVNACTTVPHGTEKFSSSWCLSTTSSLLGTTKRRCKQR